MQVYICAFASSPGLAWPLDSHVKNLFLYPIYYPPLEASFLSRFRHNGFLSLGSSCLRFQVLNFLFGFFSFWLSRVLYFGYGLFALPDLDWTSLCDLDTVLHVSSSRIGSWESFFLLNCVIFPRVLAGYCLPRSKKTATIWGTKPSAGQTWGPPGSSLS